MKTSSPLKATAPVTISSLLAASSASGVVHIISGSPIMVTATGNDSESIQWDIDNNGVDEGRVFAQAFSDTYSGDYSAYAGFQTSMGRLKFAVIDTGTKTNEDLAPVSANGKVGPTNYIFGSNPSPSFTTISSNQGAVNFEFIPKTNGLIGFSFLRDGNTHYGWADVSWNTTGSTEATLTVNEWAWNDVADAATPVPEPASIATGLGVLALGAAGLRRWRKREC
ncbi:PEP-CTERM sorting domain-containing protein [Rubellicoccus peritrichatus]|uniref:PEP-CTERM sorting domain-containing protein n=1 Tax=Rubellicoccus peritrichatus TaxID=3080537 RepID=A0AAQ3L603_9BACT|nr:PEP-CTERM sorting domain-containing protein [Puniceicoccus sp. CR14]WOO39890.1 PEP-CTERM sorting domain-containing protein [Puniceicoccus sp. CR14]